MPVSIIPLLAERLDISEERARSLLQTMLQELRRRAESDGVRFSELGTFREEDGTLTFVPSPSLRRRVNQQYEGLSSEDLAAPAPADASPEPSPFAAPEEPEEGPEGEPIPTLDPIDEDDTSEQEAPPPHEPEPSPGGRTFDAFTIISLVLAFLFVLGVGWFVLDQTNVLSPSPRPTPDVASEQGPERPDTGATSDTAAAQQPVPPGERKEQEAATSPAGNWAIVVASRSSRAAAEEMADEYRSRFDSVEVVVGTVNDRTWYRVAIGWYDSEAAAKRALDEDAPMLPSGAWIHRRR